MNNFTYFQGMRLRKTELVKTLIRAHIIAVQEYDHYVAIEIEEYLTEIFELTKGI
jgi:hypothetical protein